MPEPCIFCDIVSGIVPAKTVGSTQSSIAFMDAFPVAAGHVLIVPLRHCEKIQDLSGTECADLFGLVQNMIKKVDTLTGSTLVAAHNGRESGQEIPHVHVHLIPRDKNDGAGPVHSMFGKNPVSKEQSEHAYDAVCSA